MAASVYVVLSADASSSHKPANDVPCNGRESCFNDSPIRKTRKTRRRKVPLLKAPQKRSKRVKIGIDYDLAAPAPRDGSLSTADFDQSE
jgi:hypothetical protein